MAGFIDYVLSGGTARNILRTSGLIPRNRRPFPPRMRLSGEKWIQRLLTAVAFSAIGGLLLIALSS